MSVNYDGPALAEKVIKLQARVKETEHTMELHRENYLTLAAQSDKVAAENARLRKALEGLTNAALAGIKPLPSQVEAGFEALRELDGATTNVSSK